MKPVKLPDPSPTPNYSGIDPLDSRYYDPEIARYVSEESRVAYQAYVEAALALTLAEFKVCPKTAADEIVAAAAQVKAADVYAEEKTTRHDIKALVNCIKAGISDEAKPYVHFGATSYDIIATANALQMRDIVQMVLLPRAQRLHKTLLDLTEKYADTPQVGRTHGQHAVPITFGFAVAEYVERLGYSLQCLEWLTGELRGKFSGAVGAYNALSVFIDDPLAFEASLLARLGLQPAPYSTQILPPENLVRLIDEMKTMSGILANIGHDLRHLQRSEIAEVREKFEDGQTGSSTMAHKRNPWNFENIVSLHKQVLAQSVNANLNLASEHQRDLTDSANSRFYVLVPALLANMLERLDRIMAKLEVDPDNMRRNLTLSAGAIAAEPLYLLLEKYGHTAAHEASKTLAHQALAANQSLSQAIATDPAASEYWHKFIPAEQAIITTPETHYTGLAAAKARAVHARWQQS